MIKFFSAIYSVSQSIKIFDKWINRYIEYHQAQKLRKINRSFDDYEVEKMALYDGLEMARIERDDEKIRAYSRKLAMLDSV